MSNSTATTADAPPSSSAVTAANGSGGGNHGGGGPGKIARLPAEVRAWLNERLLYAQPPPTILDWLKALPAVKAVIARHFDNQPVTLKNLSAWETGPAYQEWSARRDLLDDARDWSGAAADTRADHPQLAQHITLLLAAQLGRQIHHLRDHPDPVYRAKALLRIARALAALRRQQLKRDQLDLAARRADFLKTHYHKPSDDLTLPIHWPSAGAFATITAELIRTVADDPVAPAWKPGDFFGSRFGPEKDAPKR